MLEMIRPSGVDVEINMSAIPFIDGALQTVEMGILSSLQPANVRLRRAIVNQAEAVKSPLYPLIFDPQTAGGLLASVPVDRADECLQALYLAGYGRACVVGRVLEQGEALEPVRLTW